MLKKSLRFIAQFFDPFAGQRNIRSLYLIGISRFLLSLLIGFVILYYIFFIGGFTYHAFFCGENHHTKWNLTMIPQMEIKGEIPGGQMSPYEKFKLPQLKSADSNDVKIYGGTTIKYTVTIYPTVKTPFVFGWLIGFVFLNGLLVGLLAIHTVLTNILERRFFVNKNLLYLRIAGVIAILSSVVQLAYQQLLKSWFHNLSSINFPDSWMMDWKMGLVFLIIAEIFYAGIRIKEENDLTV